MSPGRRLPVLFLGHGSPMNAIERNDFTRVLSRLGGALPRPRAILCVSAHWLTEGTWVTHMRRPRTIHDFHGFPPALFEVQYPAPGDPALADEVRAEIKTAAVQRDEESWGFDHGTWSVLTHLYPKADIPVVQLSIDIREPGSHHLEIGRQLRGLRERGVLIVGSGNVVHNLRRIDWDRDAAPIGWAVEFDGWVRAKILAGDKRALSEDFTSTAAGKTSVPGPDHYFPLLYALGAAHEGETPSFVYEGIQNGSISMLSVAFGMGDGA